MASIDYVQYDKTETGKAIKHAPDAEDVAKKLYRPVTRHLGDRLVIIEADDQATTLLLETKVTGVEVQLLHKAQVEAMSEGETKEWQIIHGNFGTDEVQEEYLAEDVEAATVAARLLAIVEEYDNPTPVKPTRKTSTAKANKATATVTETASKPKMPRKTSAKAQAEPEVIEEAPKRAKLPRKPAQPKVEVPEETAPPVRKSAKAKLPVKKVTK